MIAILSRRAPWIRAIIHPVRVQGEGAAEEIAAALADFGRTAEIGLPPVDLIIVGRGGGSIEDLWAFNEEIVARAIAASPVPVVSAVGHEIDFTIADFAADLRAATPSAAAELVAPDAAALQARFREVALSMGRQVAGRVERERGRLATLAKGRLFSEPGRRLRESAQRIDLAREQALRAAIHSLAIRRHRLSEQAGRLAAHRPDQILAARAESLRARVLSLTERAGRAIERKRHRLERAAASLRVLSPTATLERGYSITLDAAGHAVRSANSAKPGDRLLTRLRDGTILSQVKSAAAAPPPGDSGAT
jgi:exodeoxyribonuclease VII large subunit